MAHQLDLFEEYDELAELKKDISEVRLRSENVRKGIFARHNEISKLYVELTEKLDKVDKRSIYLEKIVKELLEKLLGEI